MSTCRDVIPVYNPSSSYTAQDKEYAAIVFLMYGSIQKVSKITGIPDRTLYQWSKKEWWENLVAAIREQNSEELNANFSRLITKSVKVIENQLDKGEVKALDAAKIMGISFDKRQILNHKPTTITSTTKISDLQQQFEDYLKAKDITADVVRTTSED